MYVIIGVTSNGHKDVLSIEIGENESRKFWMGALNSLKNRGVKDIMIICSDGFTGISDVITAAFSNAEQQCYIVHMVRNTLKCVLYKDKKAFAGDLKSIYTAVDGETAITDLEAVTDKWSDVYPFAMKRGYDNWDVLSPILKFSKTIKTTFYTINAIESVESFLP